MQPTAPSDASRSEALRAVAEALNRTSDPELTVSTILPHLQGLLGLRTAWAFLHQGGRFKLMAATGVPPALADDDCTALREDACECQSRFRHGRLGAPVNMVTCSRLATAKGDRGGLVVHASVPLFADGRPLGILNVAAPGRRWFDSESLALLSVVGHQLASALDRSLLYIRERRRAQQLQSLSEIARQLSLIEDPKYLLKEAVRLGSEGLGFRPLLLLQGDAERAAWPRDFAYSHGQDTLHATVTGDGEGALRLVAPQPAAAAYDDLDAAILNAYAAHLATALQNAARHALRRESAVLGERQRISADLHDAVSQRLFAAILTARAARLTLAQPMRANAAMDRVEEQVRLAQTELRQLVEMLRPRSFVLRDALRERIEDLRQPHGPRLVSRLAKTATGLSQTAQIALLRLGEEALHNALKHAQACTIWVTLTAGRSCVRLSIADDGVGYDPAKVARGSGSSTMIERAREAGGQLTVRTRKGGGTCVCLEVKRERGEKG